MNLTEQDLRKRISSNTYTKGASYFRNNYVIKCLVRLDTDTELFLNGEVEGNYQNTYTQFIVIKNTEGLHIHGNCSCPVGINCKHVVAVCLKHIENSKSLLHFARPSIQASNAVDSWLESITVTEPTKCAETFKDTQEYFISYRLFSTNKNSNDLQFYKSKYLKSGPLSQGTYLDSYKFVDSYYFSDIKNEMDNDIAKLAENLFRDRWSISQQAFKGAYGAILLQNIVQTGRSFFNTSKVPLQLSTEIFTPQLDFKLDKNHYTLTSNVDDNYRLLDTIPPYILNIQTNTIHEFDMNVALFNKLRTAPKILKKEIGKVYQAIGKKVPNVAIKAIKGIKTRKISTEPIPQINLGKTSFKVDFNYHGVTVKYAPQQELSTFFKEDERVEVTRELGFEAAAKEKIESFGFEVIVQDGDLTVALQGQKRQEQLKAFKEFTHTHLQELEDAGWYIKDEANFEMKFEANSEVVVESDKENDWFSLSFNLEFNGVSQPIAPLVTGIIAEFDNFESMPEYVNIEVSENHFVEVQTKQIAPIIKTIIELMDKKESDGKLKVSPYDAHMIESLDAGVVWKGSRELLELSKKLKNFKGIKKVVPPKALKATLRDYQQEGLNWLGFLHEFKFAGILADDMGLGKTIQTLAHLSKLKEKRALIKPALIVMPTSLIANWKNEAKKFTPNLDVLSLHGNDRAERFEDIYDNDILLTTYALIIRDKEKFDKISFSYIILDEAQKIKNPRTKMAIAIKEFKSEHRLALSGTPIENHLGELWSIFSFLMPGFLDTLSFFKKYYQIPIENDHDFSRQERLNRRIKPFMIRRTKELVASELPAKTEIIKYTQFENKQSALYESVRVAMEEKVKQAVEAKGLASSNITMLDALLKLRQVCCDPSLLKIKEAQKVNESAKLTLFLDLVDELLAEGRKILVFSQFTTMLSIIEEKIKARNISYTKLTGSTIKREEVIKEFTNGETDLFLISLKAGGIGLNLVEADTVIHYDPWWNPAVENQATDRAYRIGQTKAVFVYKLIVENTIEQKILELQKKKQAIQDGIYDDNRQQDDVKFSGNELLELLK